MSQTKTYDFAAAMVDYHAKRKTWAALELRVGNKAALFGALQAAGLTQVVVSFDGYGDSGQVENIAATARDVITPLKPGSIKDDKSVQLTLECPQRCIVIWSLTVIPPGGRAEVNSCRPSSSSHRCWSGSWRQTGGCKGAAAGADDTQIR